MDQESTRVRVKRTAEQVVDGTHYRGEVSITDAVFSYEFTFGVPIPQLDNIEPAKLKSDIRQIFLIALHKGNQEIDLTDDEYGFFFSLLAEFVVNFYNEPQTRGMNKGSTGLLLHGCAPLNACGASLSISTESSGEYDFPPELCEMLSAPKFGCALAAF